MSKPKFQPPPATAMVRAVIFERFGGPEVLKITNDYQLPQRQEGEVIIKVHSTSVNPIDYKMCNSDQFGTRLPRVPGGDVAGVVTEDGRKLKKGDRIIALTDRFAGPKQDGSYAELAFVTEDWAARAPNNLSLETEAGAVPLVALTAYQALASANLKPGDRVLVHAASGGVGVFAVQLAKHLFKAYVVGTTGPTNLDFVKPLKVFQRLGEVKLTWNAGSDREGREGLGADEVVNYREQDIAALYASPDRHFHAVVDPIGGETEDKSYSIIRRGGTFAHIINTDSSQEKIQAGKAWTDKRYTVTFVEPNGQQLAEVVALIEAGRVQVPIHRVWQLEQAADANREVQNGHSRGKNVLQVVAS